MNPFDLKIGRIAQLLLSHFRKSEHGTIAIEAVLMLPLLLWSIIASYTFFDGYRESSRLLKATYTVSDLISREESTINSNYIDSVYAVSQSMLSATSELSIRVSFIRFDEADDRHRVAWSCMRGNAFYEKRTDNNISLIKDRLPKMADNGKLVLIEATNSYAAPFDIVLAGLDSSTMSALVFTHPRIFDDIKSDGTC